MNSKLINRLAMSSQAALVVGLLLAIYLFLSVPATAVVSDREGELARIKAMTDLAELKAYTSGLAMVANNATHISAVLFGIVIIVLLLFVFLSFLDLVWLRKLTRLCKETQGADDAQ
jgi:hypothetical protein